MRSWEAGKSLNASRLARNLSLAPYSDYVDRPVDFMREVRGFQPWGKQADMANALVDKRRVLAYTCNGAGKSTLLAEIICWFMSTRYNARVIMTAGVGAQVQLLWRKIRGAHMTSLRPLPGEPTTQSWSISPEWYCLGTSTDYEETMQGHHSWTATPNKPQRPGDAGGLLAVIDEASGVAEFAFNAMRGYMTTENCYWIVMGNPNAVNTAFHEASTKGDFERFQISAFDVPEHILSREWIDEQRGFFGEDSPQYQVRVLGKFPDKGGDFQLIPTWLLESMAHTQPTDVEGRHMGVDIARGGGDKSVAVVTVDGKVEAVESWDSGDLMLTAQKAMEMGRRWDIPDGHIHVDVSGIGAGVVDRLREAGLAVEGVDFGGKPQHDYDWLLGAEGRFLNRKAELHWAARMLLMNGHASIPSKYADPLWKQLGWTNYEYTDRGVIRMEGKEKLRSRFGASPDYADAWILSLSRTSGRRRIFLV